MTIQPVRAAVVGCGTISTIYLQNCRTFPHVAVTACSDLDMTRAEAQAAAFDVPRALPVADVLQDPHIDLIINLTVPAAHATAGLAAIRSGKSVYNEKPLAVDRADGQLMLREAQAHGVRVGGAPDTFLGGGLQTCRALLDAGVIGEPVGATAAMFSHGPESWHPSPDFFYQPGAGPLFDMGPYYLTALIALLGPIRRVTGSARRTFAERTITSRPLAGTTIRVNTPTHIAAVLDFCSGPVATLVTSFDVWSSDVPRIEIYGTDGTLSLPDPNTFGGPVRVRRGRDEHWHDVPLTHGYTNNSRGIGVADMAAALRTARPHRADGTLAFHVLDTMHAILQASEQERHIELRSTCSRPAPLPAGTAPLRWEHA